jgi:hypothetical protein
MQKLGGARERQKERRMGFPTRWRVFHVPDKIFFFILSMIL